MAFPYDYSRGVIRRQLPFVVVQVVIKFFDR